jgi:AraC family transcriptional regulator of adaptative response / DNA-3-methyladenine glycosylase II
VRFFATAAAAAESGFRPCLRCRPESAPDIPDWRAATPVVSRALRLIGEGLLDHAGVDELAGRLNLSTRQLRRLFLQELGAPPVAVAQTRRLLFAKKLIDETHLSMAEVAFSAGYASVRRFNDAIRQTYGRTPTELRQRRRRAALAPAGTAIELKLFYRPPYDWPATLAYLQAYATPRVEIVDDQTYRRTIALGGTPGVLEVRPIPGEHAVLLRVTATLAPNLLPISERVKRIFDLKADPAMIDAALLRDPALAPIVRLHPGLRLPGAWDGYELAVRAILDTRGQAEGACLASALVDAFGDAWPNTGDPALARLFPSPACLAGAPLDAIGLTPAQADAVRAVSRATLHESLDFVTAADLDEVTERLAAVPGITRLTAQQLAMHVFGEPDAFPLDDPLLNQGFSILANGGPSTADTWQHAERWRPWRAYAAMHLWLLAHEHAATTNWDRAA